jgi:hypothetical protein
MNTDSTKMHLSLTKREKQYAVSPAKKLAKTEVGHRFEINHSDGNLGHRIDACEKKNLKELT